MSRSIEAQKWKAMVPAAAGLSLLGFAVYKLGPKSKDIDPSKTGSNGVIGAPGASTGKVSQKLQGTFGTGGPDTETGIEYETKDTRVASNVTGLYTKREPDHLEHREHRNPRVPKGANKEREATAGNSGSPEK
ncbi:uncharacterized protein B0J16DRAFT_312807 [Fusarium flagelliforme]|uniref:Uncharacterized protein n=1 Tax=Fusarium flagelliforme TaxID=2675880 RepID=A0A395N1J5_9HYPO|nr:uncharacterized protein B0J16DRAFT_312807 [Fusarium flagelliforme]KAH7196449.1 hypothetical protein B0J16DRAFT_312807 [Fusarium flagelliforme]RFN53845.1 hypothetical protein FIE12Z_1879 [Fusarium flagelliforme]